MHAGSGVNLMLNLVCFKTRRNKGVRDIPMPVHRRRFRIEEAISGDIQLPPEVDTELGPMHREVMNELRAIRAQMAAPRASAMAETIGEAATREAAEAQAMLDSYRAQIEQCEKLKVELDLIYDAITRTKREIAVLHGNSFNGEEMAKVNGELGAVVGGTEEATQQILEATEAIDNAATALSKVTSPDQQKLLSEEIQERVVSIFEACNFQDLTGQRIKKVMTTMKFIEHHITVMMDIWGGVDAIKAHAPPIVDTREGDAKLLNGPKLEGDVGHASQDDIDALFD
ncbi:chemotaxis protein CheZ [Bradyrhizobium erythrophlei]|uniref:Chemotaxis protein CheZ n=2 Tax=Bradyrhizobium erythrophlei TaxID=1437360 RepID=A0A1M7TCS2_9BRAD|nr:chemotaxis protein CheZ [Bradyrhizobium erythrophlei]